MIYPDTFESKCGFVEIRQLLAELCASDIGVRMVQSMHFSNNEEEIAHNIALTAEMQQILMMETTFPSLDYKDITPVLKRIRIEGTYIDLDSLVILRTSLSTLMAVLLFLDSKDELKYSCLKSISNNVQSFSHIVRMIDSIADKYGHIKDDASPTLLSIRREIHLKSAQVAKIMQRVLKQAQSEGWTDADDTSIRDGLAVIAVSSAFKRKISGIVHDESATGKTSYIEPIEAVENNNRIRELELAEHREIVKILLQFTEKIRPELSAIRDGFDYLGTIDFIRAKALLAAKMGAVKPIMRTDVVAMQWIKAVHPLMYLAFKREGREIVPLDISINQTQRIILISGPNAGGKSVCLKTVALIQYMYQSGLLVPMSENSEMTVFQNLFIDIGDEQSIENDLSTYSSHLMNMKYFLRYSNQRTMVLIDEFGTGTEPALGGAIAEAVLVQLNQKKTSGVITTHYTNLKHFAASADGIVNGAMLYDNHKMQPLFKLAIGIPGSSFAFEIARKIGLPEEVLAHATQRVGKDNIDFDKHLREIIRDKHYWESKREKIRIAEKKLEAEISLHSKELEQINKERKIILQTAKEQASELLSGVNRQIESAIREIRESQAEKEKTKQLRKEIEVLKEVVQNDNNDDLEKESRIVAKMEKIKQRQQRLKKKNPDSTKSQVEAPEKIDDRPLMVGDKVRMENQQMVGEILLLQGNNATVAFGDMQINTKLKKLQRISHNEYKQYAKESKLVSKGNSIQVDSFRERRLNFNSKIDVRGQSADDAIRKVQILVDDALMLGYDEVKILHGKGNGILRQMIREYLHGSGLVKSCKDEAEDMGGAGITIVTL